MTARRCSVIARACALVVLLLGLGLLALEPPTASAATYTVNSTGDQADLSTVDGVCAIDLSVPAVCTLRAAITQANATAGQDTINFNIPGCPGACTINVTGSLPTIADPIVIDGTTQPGVSTAPIVEVRGTTGGAPNGLSVAAGGAGSTIKGLIVNGFGGAGIILTSTNTVTIQRSYVGTNAAGTAAVANGSNGIVVDASSGNTIGGTASGVGNLVSGNTGTGIQIRNAGASGNLVQGNLIGTNAAGTAAVANTGNGISFAAGANGNTIGGSTSGARNVIAGNGSHGIRLSGSPNNTIQNNYIGRTTGGAALGNGGDGVQIANATTGTLVGGTGTNQGNQIVNNAAIGVSVRDTSSTNRILNNGIAANGQLGIDLVAATGDLSSGITPNDTGDADTGPNQLQNFPDLTSATSNGTTATVVGTLDSSPSTTYTIQLFANTAADPSGHGEGESFAGSTSVTTNGIGHASFTTTIGAASGQYVTATATDSLGNTSEFSGYVQVSGGSSGGTAEPPAPVDPTTRPGTLQLSQSTYSTSESAGSVTVTVTRTDGTDGTVSVQYGTADGSARAGSDYRGTSGTLTFGQGVSSQSFSVAIIDDGEYEPRESFTVGLNGPTGGATLGSPSSATVQIDDNDPAPSDVKLTASPEQVVPSDGVKVTWSGHVPSTGTDWVSLHPADAPDSTYLDWKVVRGASGSLTFDAPRTPGKYEFRLFRNGQKVRASNPVYVAGVSLDAAWLTTGQTVTVTATNLAPGSTGRRIEFHRADTSNPDDPASIPVRTVSLDGVSDGRITVSAPTIAGAYKVRLFAGGQRVAISERFTVVELTVSGKPAGTPFAPADTLTLSWKGFEPSGDDWVEYYPANVPAAGHDVRRIANAQRNGSFSMAAPYPNGTWVIGLRRAGTLVVRTTFEVKNPAFSWINSVSVRGGGTVRYNFAPGESVSLWIEVYTGSETGPAQVSWSSPAPCAMSGSDGFTPTANGTTQRRIGAGTIADACTGSVPITIQYTFNGSVSTKQTSIWIDRGSLPNVVATSLEVTQETQDLENSVRLVKNRRTFVRFHVTSDGIYADKPGYGVDAQLVVQRPGKLDVTLQPINGYHGTIFAKRSPDRAAIDDSFLFELPNGYKQDTIRLTGIVNPGPSDKPGADHSPLERDYADNTVSTSVSFVAVPQQKMVVYDTRYSYNGKYYAVPSARTDELIDYLHRTFPIAEGTAGLKVVRRQYESQDWLNPFNIGGRRTLPHPCLNLGGDLAGFRNVDIAAEKLGGERAGDIYVGLVDEGGFVDSNYFDEPHNLPLFGDKLAAISTIPLGCGWPGSRTAAYVAGLYGPGHLGINWSGPTPPDDAYVGAHEIAHAYNRGHAITVASGYANCGSEDSWPVDREFPGSGRISPITRATSPKALFGFEPVTRDIHPPDSHDLMSYCDNIWLSKHTFHGLLDTFLNFTSASFTSQARSAAAARAQQTGSRLVVQGVIDLAAGQAALQPAYVIAGAGDTTGHLIGPFAIVQRDAAGAEVARYAFNPQQIHGSPMPRGTSGAERETSQELYAVSEQVPLASGTVRLDLVSPNGAVLAQIAAGAAAPTVAIQSPTAGTVAGDTLDVTWTADDADGDQLTFRIEYSTDDGATWRLIEQHLTGRSVQLPVATLAGSTRARIRVVASDGIHTTTATSDQIVVPSRPPTARITRGEAGSTVLAGRTVTFEGRGYDASGDLDEERMRWSSSRDGELGTGAYLSIASLTTGTHTITFAVDAGSGAVATDSIQITVVATADELPLEPNALRPSLQRLSFGADRATIPLSIVNARRGEVIRWEASASQPWVKLASTSGRTPDVLDVSVDLAAAGSTKATATVTLTSPDVPGMTVEIPIDLAAEPQRDTSQRIYIPMASQVAAVASH